MCIRDRRCARRATPPPGPPDSSWTRPSPASDTVIRIGVRPDLDLASSWPGSRRHTVTRTLFKSKIHRATVTQADLAYEGSITVDSDLLDAADILEYEWVAVW